MGTARITGGFKAKDAKGNQLKVTSYTTDTPGKPGISWLQLDNGNHVTATLDGRYIVAETKEVLTPDGPVNI
jgi:hypothetical protein